jgi:hypothetical protein
VLLILCFAGILLASIYRAGMERSFDRRLGVYLRALVADVASPPNNDTDQMPFSLGEPLFELPLSGWYWQIRRLNGQAPDVRSSRSLWDGALPQLDDLGVVLDTDGKRCSYVDGPERQKLRLIERIVNLGEDGRYRIAVAGDAQEVEEETQAFDRALALVLGSLAIVLLLVTLLLADIGRRRPHPLQHPV